MHACDRRTDGQTDRRTDRILIAIPRLHYMQRGKNCYATRVTMRGGYCILFASYWLHPTLLTYVWFVSEQTIAIQQWVADVKDTALR